MSFITKTYEQIPFERPFKQSVEMPRADLLQINRHQIDSLWHQVNLSEQDIISVNKRPFSFQSNQIVSSPIQRIDGGHYIVKKSGMSEFFQKNKTQLKVIACLLGVFLVIAMALLMADSRQLRVKIDGLMN